MEQECRTQVALSRQTILSAPRNATRMYHRRQVYCDGGAETEGEGVVLSATHRSPFLLSAMFYEVASSDAIYLRNSLVSQVDILYTSIPGEKRAPVE